MIPHARYLYCLFLVHNNDDEQIIPELNKYGLPSKKVVLELAYDSFLQKLESHSKSFSTCLTTLFDDEFESCAKSADVFQYFTDRAIDRSCFKIVSDPLIKKHVECCLMTKVPNETIMADVMDVYRVDITEADIITFASLFFDINEISDTNSFIKYCDQLSCPDEKNLKNKCRANGPQYTRWAIGAKVQLDAKQMAKEMISDAFFRYKEAQNSPGPDSFDKAIKLGNLVTKLIDRDVKLSSIGADSDAEKTAQEQFGEQLCLFELKDEETKSLSDLNAPRP